MSSISHTVTVACDQQRAFDLFTSGLKTWWDGVLEPRTEGYQTAAANPSTDELFLLRHGERTFEFGSVITWDPPRHFSQIFWLATDPDHPSTLEVTFEAIDDVCTVTLVHGEWVAETAAPRGSDGDWPHLLGRYAQAAARLG